MLRSEYFYKQLEFWIGTYYFYVWLLFSACFLGFFFNRVFYTFVVVDVHVWYYFIFYFFVFVGYNKYETKQDKIEDMISIRSRNIYMVAN